jgi:sulfite reductase alpha subunit-like flavoprotein
LRRYYLLFVVASSQSQVHGRYVISPDNGIGPYLINQAHPGKIQLLIAMVEYKTNLSIPRRGLCSSWLSSLPANTRLPIKISPPTLFLPSNPSTPVILIGPGTGIAPMRAFLESRISQGPSAMQSTILYFGCRSASSDLFYADEWEKYRKMGVKIRVAISRDGAVEGKRYVQHLIREDKELIMDWVLEREGWVYISGSSNAMPREVREGIAWCLSDRLGEVEAGKYVEEMFEQGRGGEESW